MIGHLFCLLIKLKKFFTHFARRVVHVCEALNGLETAKYRSNDIQTIIQTLFNKTNFLSFPFIFYSIIYLASAKKTNRNGNNLHVKFDRTTNVGKCIR
jgi:hypothetical protein